MHFEKRNFVEVVHIHLKDRLIKIQLVVKWLVAFFTMEDSQLIENKKQLVTILDIFCGTKVFKNVNLLMISINQISICCPAQHLINFFSFLRLRFYWTLIKSDMFSRELESDVVFFQSTAPRLSSIILFWYKKSFHF